MPTVHSNKDKQMTRSRRSKVATIASFYAASFAMPALFALASPAMADPLNLVQNGTFTQTTTSGNAGGFLCANTGGSTCASQVTNWVGTCATYGCTGTSTPSSVLFAGTNGSAWNGGFGLYWSGIGDPPLGGNTLAIDGDPTYTSVLSQSITGLNVGQTYTLQFYQAASQQIGLSGATTEQWKVNLGGGASQISTLMNTPSQGAHGWQQVTMSFVASAASEVLQFIALGTPQGEPPVCLLGDVSLFAAGPNAVPTPEPGTIAIVGAGLLGLVMVRRRQRS